MCSVLETKENQDYFGFECQKKLKLWEEKLEFQYSYKEKYVLCLFLYFEVENLKQFNLYIVLYYVGHDS